MTWIGARDVVRLRGVIGRLGFAMRICWREEYAEDWKLRVGICVHCDSRMSVIKTTWRELIGGNICFGGLISCPAVPQRKYSPWPTKSVEWAPNLMAYDYDLKK